MASVSGLQANKMPFFFFRRSALKKIHPWPQYIEKALKMCLVFHAWSFDEVVTFEYLKS